MTRIKSFNATQELANFLKMQTGNCEESTTAAGNENIPAGMKSVAIVKTSASDTVTITLSDGSTYIMTEKGEMFSDSADLGRKLPAYTITGPGTIKWHGIK